MTETLMRCRTVRSPNGWLRSYQWPIEIARDYPVATKDSSRVADRKEAHRPPHAGIEVVSCRHLLGSLHLTASSRERSARSL